MAQGRRNYGDGSIYRRADGVWIGAVEISTSDGRRRRKTVSSRNRNVVVRRMRELRMAIDAGKVATAPSTTVEAYLDHWIRTVRGPHVRPNTARWYRGAIESHIVPQIGRRRLDQLTPEHVRAMLRSVAEQSTSRAQQVHTTLKTALQDAEREGIVSRNVAALVRRPQHAAKVRREFTDEQVRAIRSAMLQHDDQIWAARALLAFMTGARPGELLGLRWDYVDLEAGEIEIAWQIQELPMKHGCGDTCGKKRRAYCPQAQFDVSPGFPFEPCHRSLAFTPVKSRAGNRIVPMLPIVVATLRQIRDIDSNNPHRLVFHHTDGRPYAPREDSNLWKQLLKTAGLPADSVGYQSRHTAATAMFRAGTDENLRMAIMGHSSAVAHHGYLHVDHQGKRQALESLTVLADTQER